MSMVVCDIIRTYLKRGYVKCQPITYHHYGTSFLTFSTTVIDIVVIWMIILAALRIVRGKSSTMQIFKGIIFVIIVDVLAKVMNLKTLQFLTNMFINWGFLAVIIIFQPEIRTILERLGKSSFFSRMSSLSGNEKEKLVDNIVTAVRLLSADQTGALISIEKSHPWMILLRLERD